MLDEKFLKFYYLILYIPKKVSQKKRSMSRSFIDQNLWIYTTTTKKKMIY